LDFPIIDGYWETPRSFLCRTCKAGASKRYSKKFRISNKTKIIQATKKWKDLNKKKVYIYSRQYKQNHKDKVKSYRNKHYSDSKNIEKKKVQDRIYYQLNKDKIRKRQKEWLKKNPVQLLRCQVSMRIRKYLKRIASPKSGESCVKYFGYSIKDLKRHLEKQFEPWMNWNNHGLYVKSKWDDNNPSTWKWQIDHIIPHSDFMYDSMDHSDFKKCWALDNLRPLSAKANVLKGNRKENVEFINCRVPSQS
jgi:hypothetical protein